jgi:membrane-bound lytic murein transglycosylase MltF
MRRDYAPQIGKLARARHWLRLASIVFSVVLTGVATMQTTATAQPATAQAFRPWAGDLDGMLERGVVRILVPISPTLFYQSKGENYGAEAELGIELEKVLNQRHGGTSRKIKVVFMPTARTRLLDDLRNGRGDIVAANLTIIPERTAIVDFARPWASGIKEVLVTGPEAPKVATIADLADREIKVGKGTSHHTHLLAVNEELVKSGKRPIRIVLVDDSQENEDLLEQVNAGLLPWTIADSHIATLWSKILPNLTVREDIAFHQGGEIGWALRKDSPKLKAELDQFVQTLRSSGFSK